MMSFKKTKQDWRRLYSARILYSVAAQYGKRIKTKFALDNLTSEQVGHYGKSL